MKVLKYNAEVQKVIKSKTEPAPWLHIAVTNRYEVAIYVWDTREIVETIEVNLVALDKLESISYPANDNKKPLKGKGSENFKFKTFKITKTVIESRGKKVINWFINDIQVNQSTIGRDCYSKITNGTPSNIRSVIKIAKGSMWYPSEIRRVFENPNAFVPKHNSHDTTWGYTGHNATKKEIQELININS